MSFGAMAAWQAWGLLAVAAGVAAWLFLLKVRPPRVPVASMLLWRRVLDQTRERTWWERVRRAVSLAATIAIALALALAATRPGPSVAASSRGRLLIVVDSSWSMAARTSSGETRWQRAVAGARVLAAAAAGDPVALATTADGLVEGPTTDSALIETALETITPAGGEGTAWPRVGGVDAVHFFTDGALARQLDGEVIVHPVFDPMPNVAITAFGVRPAASVTGGAEAYLEVANYAPAATRARVTITRGTTVVLDQPVDLAAGEAVRQVLPLGREGDARILARVSGPADALEADNEAVAWFTEAEPLEVLVVSRDTAAWSTLLRQAQVSAAFVSPVDYRPGAENVVIFDRVVPETTPAKPALYLAPPAGGPLVGSGVEERQPRWAERSDHPVLLGVDPRTLDIRRARGLEGEGLDVLARSEAGTPLVAQVDRRDRRLVAVAFSVGDSNLAHSPAFPVLVANALEWLARPALGAARRPGPMSLPAGTNRVLAPDGTPLRLLPAGGETFAVFRRPGLYLVEADGARSVVSVNVGGPDVSNLGRTTLDEGTAGFRGGPTGGSRPWWMYAVMAAFVLVATEWFTWLRRVTV